MSNSDVLKSLVERISGQASIVTVLRVYIDICGDLETAAVLSQCVFWSDKGRSGDGWFYKSREEWRTEIGIKRSALESAVKRLVEAGIVESKLGSGTHNAPTTLYRVNMDNLTATIVKYLSSRLAEINQSNARSVEINQSTGLKSTNDLVEINQSSYRSLLHRSLQKQVSAAETAGVTHPIWTAVLGELRLLWNGQFQRVNPVLVDFDDEQAAMLIRVKTKTSALATDLERMLRGIDPAHNWKVELTTETEVPHD